MTNKPDLLPVSDEPTREAFTLSLDRAAREQAKNSQEYEQELEKRMLILKDNSDVISRLLGNESIELDHGLECLTPGISSMSIDCCELDYLCTSSEMNEDNNEDEDEQRRDGDNKWMERETEDRIKRDNHLEKHGNSDSFLFGLNDLEDCLNMHEVRTNNSMLGLDAHLESDNNHLDYNDNCVASGVQILTGSLTDKKSDLNIQIDQKKKKGKLGRPPKKKVSKKAIIAEQSEKLTPKVPLTAKEARMKRLAKRRQKRHGQFK